MCLGVESAVRPARQGPVQSCVTEGTVRKGPCLERGELSYRLSHSVLLPLLEGAFLFLKVVEWNDFNV